LDKYTDWPAGPLGTTAAGVAHPLAVETDVEAAVEVDPGAIDSPDPVDEVPAER
jgi:hypothetical protein